jgi:hypothetical protein
MEVCDLEECDFVETKFIEFDSELEFKMDESGKRKGVILVFINEADEFVYKYMPFQVDNYDTWMEEAFANAEPTLNWFKNVYWRLDVYSCVLVKRQREWFQSAVPEFIAIWNTILEERVSGEYINRAPKKRALKNDPKNESVNELKNEVLYTI